MKKHKTQAAPPPSSPTTDAPKPSLPQYGLLLIGPNGETYKLGLGLDFRIAKYDSGQIILQLAPKLPTALD